MARFTRNNVVDIQCIMLKHAPNNDARDLVDRAITTIYAPGDKKGPRYSGIMGDPVHVLVGAEGARGAVALLYAVGAVTGTWERVSEAANDGDQEAKRVREIMYDLNARIPEGHPGAKYFDLGWAWATERYGR